MSFSSTNPAMDASASMGQQQSTSAGFRAPVGVRINPRGIFRAATRSVGLLCVFGAAAIHYALTIPSIPKRERLRSRALWLQRWSRHCARAIGMRIEQHGDAPSSGMIVSNHLSYLDILAFSAITPCVFVAKQEVAGWPLLGFFARLAGTIFVNRASRMKVADTNACIESALQAGATVLLFAEGTSSDGRTVLPFRPALLEPMIKSQCPATPAAVSYALTDGSVADEVCYWRDMTLLPHLLNLLTKLSVLACVGFDRAIPVVSARKDSAVSLREAVMNLHQALRIA
jgi:1-acyl-sn-glycerol-3-phosphate acyltransferase